MASLQTPVCDFGRPAVGFALPGVGGKTWALEGCRGENGLLVMFICNHCPYVQAIRERLVRDTRELRDYGIKSAGIVSNDAAQYEEDSFENMKSVARQYGFPFPLPSRRDQQVAKAYGAVCTPDFLGYNADLRLQYCGRLDASSKEAAPPADACRDLLEAIARVARTGEGPPNQIPSVECSIESREE
jgi:peroxiredoxin